MKKVKIVFVGGHHTPALAVFAALHRKFKIRNSKFEFFWIGHKYSMWGDKSVSAEYQEVTARGIPFFDLKAGKLYRTFHPLKLLRLPFGFLQAFYYLLKIRPQLIVSFGGYLAPPVVIAGWLLGIPSVTHEQTVVGGWANRLVARFAKKVFVTWEESLKFFPKEKTVVTGNPIRPAIFKKTQIHSPKLKTLYVTGGKQGSHLINEVVREALPQLLKKYNVIHQCGRSSVYNDFDTLRSQLSTLKSDLRSRYLLKDYFTEEEIGAVFAIADVVVSRAGANIVYELAALGKPAILVPIPWVSHDEQRQNAQILVDAGLAVIIEEEDLTSQSLVAQIDDLFANLERFKEGGQRARKLIKLDAAEKLADEIQKIFAGKKS